MREEILRFWFQELEPKQWWVKDPALDALIRERFSGVLERAAACELWTWRNTPAGRLAEIIVLDQLSRNIHRGTPQAFATDPLALALAQEAVAANALRELSPERRPFMIMPYMHSESKTIHDTALALFAETPNLEFERRHKAIIDRFGRYPHRNEILGRTSTAEELAFLQEPGSSF